MEALASPEISALRVLLAEDDRILQRLLAEFLLAQGHEVSVVGNGNEAVDRYEEAEFDLVILDVNMPVLGGIEACQRIKAQAASRWVPVILISADGEEQDLSFGIAGGGDYYITKPISFPILQAKIVASRRIANLYQSLERTHSELAEYYNRSRAENDFAKGIIEKMMSSSCGRAHSVDSSVQPMDTFSGDLVATELSRSGQVYAVVADATGHGLPAAMTLMPALEIFYAMSRKGFTVSTIVREMNLRLKQRLTADRFLAALVLSYDPHSRMLEVWNGGCPPGHLLQPDHSLKMSFPSRQPPLGILSNEDFSCTTERVLALEHSTFVACSDGIIEARNLQGEMFGNQRLLDIITAPGTEGIAAGIRQALTDLCGSAQQSDDQSVLVLKLPGGGLSSANALKDGGADPAGYCTDSEPSQAARPLGSVMTGGWNFTIELTGPQLGEMELVPLVNNVLDQLRLSASVATKTYVVLTELINNAIDHGVLGLDSSLKQGALGFETYFNQREKRLAELTDGYIHVSCSRESRNGNSLLRLLISDSGNGFDYRAYLDATTGADTRATHGRGIRLVNSLADSMSFIGRGESVEVELYLDQ
ncbi:ATP-binding SpoIIE family protein phosphatase [Allohahella sp. A8]|uniref:ATP-binding SpoIIE family protein phosphatase n=1 Tax=Allohahella sp. A8 TaxID=3141461 RepID=UPI003A802AD3